MVNRNRKQGARELANWAVVWGLIFGVIALETYLNFRQKDEEGKTYRSQYQVKVQEADSLRRVKEQLEKQLFDVQTALDQHHTTDLSTPSTSSDSLSSALVHN